MIPLHATFATLSWRGIIQWGETGVGDGFRLRASGASDLGPRTSDLGPRKPGAWSL